MRCVGIDPDLRLRDQAGEQVAELGGDHLVVVALDDQRRALDPGQSLQRAVVGDAATNAIICRAVSAIVLLASPVEEPTPA